MADSAGIAGPCAAPPSPATVRSRRAEHRAAPSVTTAEHLSVVERAQAVLARNQRGTWTCPSSSLYPHQWLWDSCFIAIGLARYDAPRAADEIRALFRGQWANGMLPHMIFAAGVKDVGSRRVWQSHRQPLAPRDVDTSCVTQPPLVAIAARAVAARCRPPTVAAFLAEVLPKLVAYHSWLYRERDPSRVGTRHAHPPVGVRARHDSAVDARARTDADAVVAAGRVEPCGSPASCGDSATTRATCPRSSGRPTTTACACSRS